MNMPNLPEGWTIKTSQITQSVAGKDEVTGWWACVTGPGVVQFSCAGSEEQDAVDTAEIMIQKVLDRKKDDVQRMKEVIKEMKDKKWWSSDLIDLFELVVKELERKQNKA